VRAVEAAIEYENCGRDAKRYSAQFPKAPRTNYLYKLKASMYCQPHARSPYSARTRLS
jgi:hypothetical protein